MIELSFFKGLSQTEIAAKIGVPVGTVKGRQRLALEKLHERLVRRTPAGNGPLSLRSGLSTRPCPR